MRVQLPIIFLHKTNTYIKRSTLFAIALILSVTSLTTLIAPKAAATSLPNMVADPEFNIGSGFDGYNDYSYTTAIQPDGKILVGGGFTSFNGSPQNALIRLNPDGTKDTSFDIGSGFGGSFLDVYSIKIQPDGKILVGGWFTTYNGTTQNRLIRLNTNGSKDTSFDIGTGFTGPVEYLYIQPDGKILAGGQFNRFNNLLPRDNRIIRLNTDGSRDITFDTGAISATRGFNLGVGAISYQTDGKILVGGWFTTYNGTTQNRLVRLNTDGSKDTSFDIGSGFSAVVNSTTLQPDAKILVGGDFTTFNGATQNRLVRLNADGTKDTSFNIGSGLDGNVISINIQTDGKILVGGFFTNFNGQTQNRLIRLNPDGSKDTSFDIGSGFNNIVNSVILQSDGKILVGGNFTTYQGATHNRLIRLQITPDRDQDGLNDSVEDSSPNSGDANNDGTQDSLQNHVSSYINPLSNNYHTIQVDNQCSLTNVSTNPSTNNSSQDTNYNYPLGLYNFTANCATPGHTTSFKVYYYNADTTKNYTLRKYNPNTNTYTTIDTATFAIETIAGQPVLTATYNITDGSSLDTDGLVNGTIVDPAGPALTNPTTATLPTAPNTGADKNNLIVTILAIATISLIAIISYMIRNKRLVYKI